MVGNTPNYHALDIFRAFLLLERRISRADLMRALDLGEGTMRTILDILKEKGLLESSQQGHVLSSAGRRTFAETISHMSLPQQVELEEYPEHIKVAVAVKGAADVPITMKLRDSAVKQGADGALIFIKKEGILILPHSDGIHCNIPQNQPGIDDNDALIVAFAHHSREAELGALAVATEMDPALKGIAKKIMEQD
jgi:hypothetical protein